MEIFGYPLNIIELLGVATGLVYVFLASMEKIANFYFGLANSALYFAFFYQQQLYSMMLLQVVYFALCCYGLYNWSKVDKHKNKLKISRLNIHQCIVICMAIGAIGIIWAKVVVYIAGVFPETFPAPSHPKIDSLITVASISAQILLTRKRLETWAFWVVIDLCSTIFCIVMGLYFTAALYAIYCGIGARAFFAWRKELNNTIARKKS